ncbi:hypothetical protein ATANTOWER_014950 [Ataeniobius toweri]|uniref:Uncharacterized protein n=1 Tax=Ataeniobius toweri TaxID=208326 RepID=A0ABU7B9B7_9TELE|nr:hypothetical protein [Ataeniobius toweri]
MTRPKVFNLQSAHARTHVCSQVLENVLHNEPSCKHLFFFSEVSALVQQNALNSFMFRFETLIVCNMWKETFLPPSSYSKGLSKFFSRLFKPFSVKFLSQTIICSVFL